jgi:hypothetical protein
MMMMMACMNAMKLVKERYTCKGGLWLQRPRCRRPAPPCVACLDNVSASAAHCTRYLLSLRRSLDVFLQRL